MAKSDNICKIWINGTSIKILKSHALTDVPLCDFKIFIDAPLNYPARVDAVRHKNDVSSPHIPDFRPFRLK